MEMEYSRPALALTERFEGVRFIAYQDSVGVWTVGYGHTFLVFKGMSCTQEQAEQWLITDLAAAVKFVNIHVQTEITQGEFDALVDFVFNLGCGSLEHSTLLRLVNERQFAAAANEFDKWDRAGGHVVAGLLRRRLAEEAEFIAT